MCAFSTSSSVGRPAGTGSFWNWKEKSAARISWPRQITIARSMAFSSSRTLPGQACRINTSSALADTLRHRAAGGHANLLRKWLTSTGMSSRRSRSGGRWMQKTFRR